jgi:NhaD family Na+/H+ antiporter
MTKTNKNILISFILLLLFFPVMVFATESAATRLDLTQHWVGYTSLAIFVLAYIFVILEEHIHMRKSKPVIVAAGLIWTLIALVYREEAPNFVAQAIRHNLLEYSELLLFLLAAMTYINTMDERGIFKAIRAWLVNRGFSLRVIFWLTGLLAFFISPVADNLTTALLMATVVMAIGGNNKAFVTVGCINIVVAANAGGAFSPFGDITTLMVWQKGIVEFEQFLVLFIPSVVNWVIPAAIMSLTIPKVTPEPLEVTTRLRHGAFVIVGLFILTITMAVCGHNFLHMPPVIGMMTGLGLLKLFGYYLSRRDIRLMKQMETARRTNGQEDLSPYSLFADSTAPPRKEFNIFISMKRAEWDTLMFFYGIILCVGGLGTVGYLEMVSQTLYGDLGPTTANILVGLLSAIVDNIPVMFAVLSMNPDMVLGQWLLVTLTAGVGGSLLSIGSAAGVAVMGQARGIYTFFGHLKWIWAIALGYAASIWVHFLVNESSFAIVIGTG